MYYTQSLRHLCQYRSHREDCPQDALSLRCQQRQVCHNSWLLTGGPRPLLVAWSRFMTTGLRKHFLYFLSAMSLFPATVIQHYHATITKAIIKMTVWWKTVILPQDSWQITEILISFPDFCIFPYTEKARILEISGVFFKNSAAPWYLIFFSNLYIRLPLISSEVLRAIRKCQISQSTNSNIIPDLYCAYFSIFQHY